MSWGTDAVVLLTRETDPFEAPPALRTLVMAWPLEDRARTLASVADLRPWVHLRDLGDGTILVADEDPSTSGLPLAPPPGVGSLRLRRLDPSTGTISDLPEPPRPVSKASLVVEDGKVHLLGGIVDGEVVRDTWTLTPTSPCGRWKKDVPLPSPRALAGVLRVDGDLLLVGGQATPGVGPSVPAILSRGRKGWTEVGRLPEGCDVGDGVADAAVIEVTCRADDGETAWRMDRATGAWSRMDLPDEVRWFGFLSRDLVLASTREASTLLLEREGDGWTERVRAPGMRTAWTVGERWIWFVPLHDEAASPLLWDRVARTVVPPQHPPRDPGAHAVGLDDGRVLLVTGGQTWTYDGAWTRGPDTPASVTDLIHRTGASTFLSTNDAIHRLDRTAGPAGATSPRRTGTPRSWASLATRSCGSAPAASSAEKAGDGRSWVPVAWT